MALMEVGRVPTLDHVSVSMGIRVGELLHTQDPVPAIGVNEDELLKTLDGLGEFDAPLDPVPLSIHFPFVRWRGQEGGFAVPIIENGELVERAVIVPLFRVSYADHAQPRKKLGRRTLDDYVYDYDSEKCNEILLHELKHAVDYLNPELREQQKQYERKDKMRVKRMYGALMAMTMYEAGVVEVAFSGAEVRLGGAAACIVALRSLMKQRNRALKTKQYYNFNSYLNSPLERRAYRVSDGARKQGKIPYIVGLEKSVS